jgi:hypothetical protein
MAEDGPDAGAPLPPRPVWLQATLEDIAVVDFEATIAGSTSIELYEFGNAFVGAQKQAEADDDQAAVRVFAMLTAITQMYFRPNDKNEPYGPLSVLTDRRRTPIPADYRTLAAEVAALATKAQNPVLRARLADIGWLLDRRQAQLARDAVANIVDVIGLIDATAKSRAAEENVPDIIAEIRALGSLGHEASDYLRRALQISYALGQDKPEWTRVAALVESLRQRALATNDPRVIFRYCSLDLDFDLSPTDKVAADIERHIATPGVEDEVNSTVRLWQWAADGYRRANREGDCNRCLREASERWAREASKRPLSAMLASHYLSSAIIQLNGVPGQVGRRKELRHLLIDAQASIGEEMEHYSVPLDYEKLAAQTQEAFKGRSLKEKLFGFASMFPPPEPAELIEQAKKAIEASPLSSMFETAHIDSEGKTVSISGGSSPGDTEDGGAIEQQIAQFEGIRRAQLVGGAIDPGRRAILSDHLIADDIFTWLLIQSPFVPPTLLNSYARGFTRFFQGDMTSALYILTPQLEASLRYVLKNRGLDVSVFDTNTKIQRDLTLSNLFDILGEEIDKIFTPAIAADINRLFSQRPGPAVRHSLAHGLLHDGSPYDADGIYAIWLMFKLCVLPLLRFADSINLPDGT